MNKKSVIAIILIFVIVITASAAIYLAFFMKTNDVAPDKSQAATVQQNIMCNVMICESGCQYNGFAGIQQGIDAAPSGTESDPTIVCINPGTYQADSTNKGILIGRGDHPAKQNIIITTQDINNKPEIKGVADKCVISIDGKGNDGSVVQNVEISGLVIQGGNCGIWLGDLVEPAQAPENIIIKDDVLMDHQTNGISVHMGKNILVVNNEIKRNSQVGIKAEFSVSGIIVEGNKVDGNLTRGLFFHEVENAIVRGNVITNNGEAGIFTSYGNGCTIIENEITGNGEVGITMSSAQVNEINGNNISGNLLAGMDLYGESHVLKISRNLVDSNGFDGVSFFGTTQVDKINNNIISRNDNSGIYIWRYGNVQSVENNDIVGNRRDGFVTESEYTTSLVNNIITQNQGRAVGKSSESPDLIFNHNDSWSNGTEYTEGTGNISVDPMFTSYPTEPMDFRLKPGSPARDTGDPAILDKDGSRSDMGAYGGPDPLRFRTGLIADLNADGQVNGADYLDFVTDYTNFKLNGKLNDRSDLNDDQKVNLIDYLDFVTAYSKEKTG